MDCSQVAFKMSTTSLCRGRGAGDDLTISWTEASPKGSFCQLGDSTGKVIDRFSMCGPESSWTKTSPNCAAPGDKKWAGLRTKAAGSYSVCCARFMGKNEFGQSRGFQWMGKNGQMLLDWVEIKDCDGSSAAPAPAPSSSASSSGPRISVGSSASSAPMAERPTAEAPTTQDARKPDKHSEDGDSATASSQGGDCAAKGGKCLKKSYCQGSYFASSSYGCGDGLVCCKGTELTPDSSDANDDGCIARGGKCGSECSGNFLVGHLGCKNGLKCCVDDLVPAAMEQVQEEEQEPVMPEKSDDLDFELDDALFDALYGKSD
jgi:hypothetical protein